MSENPENQGQGSQEGHLVSVPEVLVEKKPVCWLSSLSGISLFLFVPAFILMIICEGASLPYDNIKVIAGIVMGYSIVGSPVIAVMAKIRIALSNGRLGGGGCANTVLIISSGLLILAAGPVISMDQTKIIQRVMCENNLKVLARAMQAYAEKNGDQLPTASQWCDLLITEADVSPESFLCRSSGAVYGESSYAMNSQAAGKKLSELPSGMVLLFETNVGRLEKERADSLTERDFIKQLPELAKDKSVYKDRWNQVGGPEVFAKNHKDGTNVAFTDDYTSLIFFRYPDKMKGSGLESLVWDQADHKYAASDYLAVSEVFEKPRPPFLKSVIALGVSVVAMGLVVIFISRAWRYPLLCLITVLGGSLVGSVFGGMAEGLYHPEHYKDVGGWGGVLLGLWTGLCYAGILMRLQIRIHRDNIGLLATSLGMAAGLVCSTLLHLMLILINHEPYGFVFMGAGLPFGIIGGAILGAVSGAVVRKFYVRPEVDGVAVIKEGL